MLDLIILLFHLLARTREKASTPSRGRGADVVLLCPFCGVVGIGSEINTIVKNQVVSTAVQCATCHRETLASHLENDGDGILQLRV